MTNSDYRASRVENQSLIRRGLKSVINAGHSVAKAIVRGHRRRTNICELRALNDHTLKDIGLHRSQISSVVEEMLNAPARSPALAETTGTTRKAGESAAIRKATPKDAEAACAVLVRSIKEICAPYYENDEEILAQWLENKTPSNVRRWIESDRSYSVVAENGQGQVFGFASVSGFEIRLNYVLPEVIHQGIGKRMLHALESYAIASGVEHIHVVSTIPAKAFYERNGYVCNGPARQVGRIIGDFPLVKTIPHNNAFERARMHEEMNQ